MRKKVTSAFCALALFTGILVGIVGTGAQPASASAADCALGGIPNVCVYVNGSGTWAKYVRGGIQLDGHTCLTGHWHIWSTDGRINFNTGVHRHCNTGLLLGTAWSSNYDVRKHLVNLSHVKATFTTVHGRNYTGAQVGIYAGRR